MSKSNKHDEGKLKKNENKGKKVGIVRYEKRVWQPESHKYAKIHYRKNMSDVDSKVDEKHEVVQKHG